MSNRVAVQAGYTGGMQICLLPAERTDRSRLVEGQFQGGCDA
ncbi:MAG: hypothetical protein OXG03_00645 [Gammaproteobacteria bacterium]|nr:hypothetical protein [Gammaproteobacteria bacterium]